nr:hypothetical protein CTI12_AA399840 [Tanacetum cinerariifolium]
MLGDLNVTLKDLSGTIPRTIHYKVLDVGSYRKDITVGAAMILANVSVFTPKPSQHYLNITMRNVIEVFCKDTEVAVQVEGIAKGVAESVKEVVKEVTRVVKEAIEGNVRMVNMSNDQGGYSYKEFMACNPKGYDGKGGAIAYTRWIEKTELVRDMSGCGENQKVKYYAGMLTGEAIRNGALKKNSDKRGNSREHSKEVKDDNNISRTRREFATTTNLVRKEYTVNAPKCTNYNYHHQSKLPCRLCTNCYLFGNLAKDCRVGSRVVNTPKARNPTASCGACF